MSELFQARRPNLGFGNMRMPRLPDGSPDIQTIYSMIDTFLSHGFSYFDTAHIYDGSEEMLRIALVERYPRDRYQITTKLYLGECTAPEDMMRQFDVSRERLGLDTLDMYFLHGLGPGSYAKLREFRAFDFLRSLRDRGLAEHIGFSFHGSAEELDGLLQENPDIDLVQLQLNYLDWEDDKVQSRLCYEAARRHGVPISVMEPCKGGLLAGRETDAARLLLSAEPDVSPASWAFRFIAGLEGIHVILSGMSDLAQVEDNCRTFESFRPLSEEELALTTRAVELINAVPSVPCTGCKYCTRGCPQNLNIPMFMNQYNSLLRFNNLEISRHSYAMATRPARGQAKASACIGCRSCEERCPQHIEITKYLQELVEKLEV